MKLQAIHKKISKKAPLAVDVHQSVFESPKRNYQKITNLASIFKPHNPESYKT